MKIVRYAETLRRKHRGYRYADTGRRRKSRVDRIEVLEQLAAEDVLPAIYFIFSRAGCQIAFEQCLRAGLDFTDNTEKGLIDQYLTATEQLLSVGDLTALGWHETAEGLRRGVATHHAGMLPAFKELVEKLFVEGLLSVVFATETLAVGINMPARSVVIEELDKFDGDSHVSLTAGEFTQLTGRAGRRGIDREGFATVVWQEGLEPGWVGSLASARTFPLNSRFRPDYNMSVNLINRVGFDQARIILAKSFAQYQADHSSKQHRSKGRDLAAQFDRVTRLLAHLGYLSSDDQDFLITPAGLVLSRLHTEQDLLLAEAIRLGLFDGLAPAGLASVVTCVVFEPRRDSGDSLGRLPPEPISNAIIEIARLAESLHLEEGRFDLNFVRPIEAGLARPMWRWANGASLLQVLGKNDFTVGDFFRWSRQCIDVLRQISRASEGSQLSKDCLQAVTLIDRGVVAMAGRP